MLDLVISLFRCLSILLPSSSVTGVVVSFVPIVHINYNARRRRRRRRLSTSLPIVWSSRRRQRQVDDAYNDQQQPAIIVVGKIIVDEYGDPESSNKSPTITVGGGGPQAAIGAALGLAAWSLYEAEEEEWDMDYKKSSSPLPPKQPVSFMAAVGDLDFTNVEQESLMEILSPALLYEPCILRGQHLMTPRIRLWHDDNQVLQWFALNDSFGPAGAGGLWGMLPAVEDYLSLVNDIRSQQQQRQQQQEKCTIKPILYVISEGGKDAPGNNGDSFPLLDTRLRNAISYLGVEPILFPQENGDFCEDNANHCATLLQRILDATPPTNKHAADYNSSNNNDCPQPPIIISPDMAAFMALQKCTAACMSSSCDNVTWAVRHGPNGSQIIHKDAAALQNHILKVPAATLNQLVNPTGAGNAFAAAFTALRGSGCNVTMSACLATGVGAVFCEYNHCPPYTWEVIQRVVEASREVRLKLNKQ